MVVMYHPGKIIAVLSPKDKGIAASDSSVQAVLRMWDDNVLTMIVEPKIAPKVREGDMVLADYRPEKGMSVPVPRHTVVKILRGKAAERAWHEYRDVHEKRRRHETQEKQAQQSYIG